MSLQLYMHPLSSYCFKALIALYENDTPFEPIIVDLGNEASRSAFQKVWPLAKFPVLRDYRRHATVPESTIVIEYLDVHYPGRTQFIPKDPELAWQTRLHDRFFDLYVHNQLQTLVANKLRPDDKKDPLGAERARAQIKQSYAMIDQLIAGKTWVMGEQLTLADCAAAPALYYCNLVEPIEQHSKDTANYLARLMARPSFARVLKEAEPYLHMFPGA